jgi:hypothetical protein
LLSHLFFDDDSLKVIAATPLSRLLPVSSDEMMLLALVYHNVIRAVSIKREQELVLEYTYS